MGMDRDNQDHYELQNYTTAARARTRSTSAGRLRFTRDASYSTAGFNGNYIYSSLNTYQANTPSEYNVTAGKPEADVNSSTPASFSRTITRRARTSRSAMDCDSKGRTGSATMPIGVRGSRSPGLRDQTMAILLQQ